MERVFQNYVGTIESFKGIAFSEVKSFINEPDNDVILIWLKSAFDGAWYRIFIDGAYCGVDKYQTDNSSDDLDEYIKVIDHTSWFKDKTVISANVLSNIDDNSHIVLTLRFPTSSCHFICKSEEGDCHLKLEEASNA